MRALVGIGAILAGAFTVGSCAEGREPPEVTPTVSIERDLVFTFGPETWCTVPPKAEPDCRSANEAQFPILWPQVKVQLAPFAIDIHEVTNLQYAYCIAAGGCSEKDIDHAGNTFNIQDYYGNPQYDDYPVVQVTWDSAAEYCAFVGKRLPTQAEWERVATGGDGKHRRFPIEDAGMTDFNDCLGESVATYYCGNSYNMQRVMATDVDFVEENGQRIYQLMGNVAEYTSDTRDSEGDITCKGPPPGNCKRVSECESGNDTCGQWAHVCPACAVATDPCYYMCQSEDPNEILSRQTIVCTAYPEAEQPISASQLASSSTGSRVVRGGNITVKSSDDACQMTSTFRDKVQDPSTPSPTVGFRCARTL